MLTKNNYKVSVVTRNIHEKGHKIKIMGNAGFIDLVEVKIFDEKKLEIFLKMPISVLI